MMVSGFTHDVDVVHTVEVEERLGFGYQAVCICGWHGMLRTGDPAPDVAVADALEHAQAAEER